MEKLIKLFKSVIVSKVERNKPTIINGILYTSDIVKEYNIETISKEIEKMLLLTAVQVNSSFHKSWEKIRNAKIEQLVIEQIIHYMTTYGYKELGIYNKDLIYIPPERLEIPEINIENIELVIVNGVTKKDLKNRIMGMLTTGIALNENTLKDIIEIIESTNIDFVEDDLLNIKNKEFKMCLYDKLGLEPKEPVEILRYIIYKMTNETLLIKNKELIEKIKDSTYQYKMNKKTAIKLSSIFNRFKPLFLAMKSIENMSNQINRIKKLSKIYHKPMKQDYLNNITSNNNIDITRLKNELSKVNIYRKIRLANVLKYRMLKNDSILYKIRNGKSYATSNKNMASSNYFQIYDIIKKEIKKDIEKKKIYIPNNIKYALPSSEKQFTGNIPSGSSIEMKENMIFGIYWENINGHSIDLDLSLMSIENKFGWDGNYRNLKRSILFSGDITDAPRGATELFYIANNEPGVYLVMLNYYNYNETIPVSFKVFIAEEKIEKMKSNYMVSSENIKIEAETEIKRRQKMIGMVKVDNSKSIFYFCEVDIGMSITSSEKDYIKHCRNYIENYYSNLLEFNDIINLFDKEDCDIDLSPKNLTKDKILDILKRA